MVLRKYKLLMEILFLSLILVT